LFCIFTWNGNVKFLSKWKWINISSVISSYHKYQNDVRNTFFLRELIKLYIWCLKDKPMWSQRGSQMSNCYKVHPDTNPGPFSHCGQEDISKRTEKVRHLRTPLWSHGLVFKTPYI
jgi:hypothetical protein